MNVFLFCRMIKEMMSKINVKGYDQHMHENIMWERTLDFYLQQNAFLKTKLSLALDSTTGKQFLAEAEIFQNIFLQNDENIKELKLDIDLLERSLRDGTIDEIKLERTYARLNNEINNFEKNFAKLKYDFNNYMLLTRET
ncbi:MAG: hypothetical protein ABIT58_09505 [Ferruginibacter sp.]